MLKVTSLPCEAEWYLNLTFVVTMSIRCHLCAHCVRARVCVHVCACMYLCVCVCMWVGVGGWIAQVCTSVCLAGGQLAQTGAEFNCL